MLTCRTWCTISFNSVCSTDIISQLCKVDEGGREVGGNERGKSVIRVGSR